MVCDAMNFYLIIDPTDPGYQFSWLETELRKAEANKESVMIINHIPFGETSSLDECGLRYKALVNRFTNTIIGQFSGHTHYDEIKVNTAYFDKHTATGTQFIAPSVTTYTRKNPSFRIFELDIDNMILLDYKQYIIDLNQANNFPLKKPDYQLLYSAVDFFEIENLNDYENLKLFAFRIEKDDELYRKVLLHYFGSEAHFETYNNYIGMPRYLTCLFSNDIGINNRKCGNFFTIQYDDMLYQLFNILSGKWFFNSVPKFLGGI